jgi:2'-hydroxyisoflavone reductase
MRIREGGEFIAPGTLTDPVQMVDARDLAAFVIRMADGRVAGAFTAVRRPMGFGEMRPRSRPGWVPPFSQCGSTRTG